MFNSTSILDKAIAGMTETCLHGTTEELAPSEPLLFCATSELRVSKNC